MSDAQKIKDAVEELQRARKEINDKLKTASNQIRQVRQEQAGK